MLFPKERYQHIQSLRYKARSQFKWTVTKGDNIA